MGEIHKPRGIGDNSDVIQKQSPTVEALKEQFSKVGKLLSNITNELCRISEQVRGSHGDEIVVNPYERKEGMPDWHRVVRKPTKYERNELLFEANEALSKEYWRLTFIYFSIKEFLDGEVVEVSDQQKKSAKPVQTLQSEYER